MNLNGQLMMTEVFPDMYPSDRQSCVGCNGERDPLTKKESDAHAGDAAFAFAMPRGPAEAPPEPFAAGCVSGTMVSSYHWYRCRSPIGSIGIIGKHWYCENGSWKKLPSTDTGCMDAKTANEWIEGYRKLGLMEN
ncbi:MAG: hypothetical protein IT461_11600 [Planctomycetes bacterium]|jgi:hypothetical protein|nr:hypothetical protein [Planctomycetota bacterium]